MRSDAAQPVTSEAQIGGHPTGLTVLTASTVWESFALAAMKAGLVYYIVDELHVAQAAAVQIYGFATATTYLMALVGAGLADRYLGLRRATTLGALLMALGLFLLIQPQLLYPALLVVAVGNGLFKPTALAQVGLLYAEEDPRRDRAFNLYYMGMNFGAIVAPLVSGVVAALYGWTFSFLTAAGGMIVSAALYGLGWRHLPDLRRGAAAAAGLGEVAPPAGNRATILVVILVWVGAVLFWTAYSQVGSTFALWAEHDVARSIRLFGRTLVVPAAWLQSINPILILMAAPLVNMLWARAKGPAGVRVEIRKMILGSCLLALAFLIFSAASIGAARSHGSAGLVVVLLAFVPFTVGELYVAPVGQALFSRLARRGYSSILMAVWILTMMMGYLGSGMLGGFWTRLSPGVFFAGIAALALVSAAVFFLARRRAGRSEGAPAKG